MINVSGSFRQRLYADKRNYLEKVKITLADSTVLNLTNEHIWGGSLSFEDAVSSDDDLDIGAAIVNKQELTINNIYGTYDEYDFAGALVETQIGLVIDESTTPQTEEWITKGTFIVDEADYNETYITLSCLDYMSKFDKKFPSSITFGSGITAGYIISSICTHCGVTLGNASFPNYNFELETGPTTDCTCRDVISWIAQICGCFARCGPDGKLNLKWYDRDALDDIVNIIDGGVFDTESETTYVTGDDLDGGSFNPWDTGDVADGGGFVGWASGVHYISSTFSHSVSVDDVVITGVRILVKTTDNGTNDINTYSIGTTEYVVEISDNPLITDTNVTDVLDMLDDQLIGLTFRKANLTTPSDPSIEAGDVAIYWDRKGNHHPIIISRVTFCPGESQTIVSAAQTPSRNSSDAYSAATRAYLEMKNAVKTEKSAREQSETALATAIANAAGLYCTPVVDSQTQATTYYLHNKGGANGLAQSDIRIMFSAAGIALTANGTASSPTWYGITADGNAVVNILSAAGINADWIRTGSLSVGGTGTMQNGAINVYDVLGTLIGKWNKDGIQILQGTINIGNGMFAVDINGNVVAQSVILGNGFRCVELIDITPSGTNVYQTFYGGDKTPFNHLFDSRGIYFDQLGVLSLTARNNYSYTHLHFNEETSSLGLYHGQLNTTSWNVIDFCQTGYAARIYRNAYSDEPFKLTWDGKATFAGKVTIGGDLSVAGTKPRLVDTDDYGKRFLYAYETPTPMFGDIGEGVVGEDGYAYISIDPTFAETVSTTQYQVFLQPYGEGDIYIKERKAGYFVVKGTAGLAFGWEIKAKQRDYENYRLEKKIDDDNDEPAPNYGEMAQSHIEDIQRERTGEAA